jgi:predicted nucleotide-binding protein
MHSPLPELQLERNVFIVHGRDSATLKELQSILTEHGATPRVLKQEEKNAQNILTALEDLLRICKAGFILATPDDEGHLFGSKDPLTRRARENVIFETGLLFAKYRDFKRVTILLKEPLKLPSDLEGISYESFADIREIESNIVKRLGSWKVTD